MITQALIDDHRLIDRILVCLEKAANRLEKNEDIRPGFFIDVANFNKGFIENFHQKIEEGILFEAMVKYGLPKQDSSLTIVILEHEQSRLYARRMRAAAERWQSGNKTARREIIRNALGYVSLLRQHLQDEDNKVYPKANKIIPNEAHQNVMDAFEKFTQKSNEPGIREKFIKLIASLESEIA